METLRRKIIDLQLFIQQDFNLRSYVLLFSFLTILISFNYSVDFEDSYLDKQENRFQGVFFYFLFYFGSFLTCMFLMYQHEQVKASLKKVRFYLISGTIFLVFLSSKYFDFSQLSFFSEHPYFNYKLNSKWNDFLHFVLELILLGLVLGKLKHKGFGLWNFKQDLKIYFIFLLIMAPLIFAASLNTSFLESYPRLNPSYFVKDEYLNYFLMYEPFYLLSFIHIEWLFRGFLVLMLAPFLGKRAIILVATLYCMYHFGKPMGECISSFFGGYILGLMVYRSRSIWGGVILHMGVALLMDLFALAGHLITIE